MMGNCRPRGFVEGCAQEGRVGVMALRFRVCGLRERGGVPLSSGGRGLAGG